MRVLWVNTVAARGGAERSLMELAVALGDLGCVIEVACPDGPLAAALAERRIPVHRIGEVRLRRPTLLHPGRLACVLDLLAARTDLRRIVRRVAPDRIHANSLTALMTLPPDRDIPSLWHVRDLAMPRAAARWGAARADAVIAISPSVETRLRSLLPEKVQARLHLIPNGIALPDPAALSSRREARSRLGLPGDAPLVGLLAHAVPWKRHDRLIAAAARLAPRHPAIRYVLAGGDLFGEHAGYRQRLRGQIRQAGLGAAFIEFGVTDQPLFLLRAFDLLVHPADAEPFGRVICEAMAVGTPVIAMNRAGPRDILRHGETGWLVDPDEPDGLALAIEHLLKDAALRDRLAGQAAVAVRQSYDIRLTAQRLSLLYQPATTLAAAPDSNVQRCQRRTAR